MRFTFCFLALALCSNAAVASIPRSTAKEFSYNPQTGRCTNSQNQAGLNPVEMSQVFVFDQGKDLNTAIPTISKKNVECGDLRSIHFSDLLASGSRYVHLQSWNLRGAVFAGSDLKWMFFEGGTLAGANFTGSTLGYTVFANVQRDSSTQGLEAHCLKKETPTVINCQI